MHASVANNDGATPLQQTMKIPKVIERLAEIEDILGDDYELDWLKRVVTSSKEHRVIVLDDGYKIIKNGEE